MIVCIQCTMRAMLKDELSPFFDETTLEEHMRKEHPDPVAAAAERRELEQQLTKKLAEQFGKEEDNENKG